MNFAEIFSFQICLSSHRRSVKSAHFFIEKLQNLLDSLLATPSLDNAEGDIDKLISKGTISNQKILQITLEIKKYLSITTLSFFLTKSHNFDCKIAF